MIAPIAQFSAYRQLQAGEKIFVDGYVYHLEEKAAFRNERISALLLRAPDPEIVRQSNGMFDRALVRAAIHEKVSEIAAATEFTPRRVIREIGLLAFSNMGDYVQPNIDGGGSIELDELTRDQWAAVSEVKTEEQMGREGAFSRKNTIKLHSKLGALEMITKLMGLYEHGNPAVNSEMSRPVGNAQLTNEMSETEMFNAYNQIKDIR